MKRLREESLRRWETERRLCGETSLERIELSNIDDKLGKAEKRKEAERVGEKQHIYHLTYTEWLSFVKATVLNLIIPVNKHSSVDLTATDGNYNNKHSLGNYHTRDRSRTTSGSSRKRSHCQRWVRDSQALIG